MLEGEKRSVKKNLYSCTRTPALSKHRQYLWHFPSSGISQVCHAVVRPLSCYEIPPLCWGAVQGHEAVEAEKAGGQHCWRRLPCRITCSPKQAPLKSTACPAFSPSPCNSIYSGFSSTEGWQNARAWLNVKGSHIFIAFFHAWSWHKCLILQPLHGLNTLMVHAESSSRMGPCGIADFCAIDISSQTWEMLIASFAVLPWWPY